MDEKKLEELIASSITAGLKPATDGIESVGKRLDGLEARLKTVEEGGQPKNPASGAGNEVDVNDLTAAISRPIVEAVGEMKKAVQDLVAGKSEGGKPKTFTAEALETYRRYDTTLGEDDEPTVENLTATINQVKSNTGLSDSQRRNAVETLVAMKMGLQREQRRQTFVGAPGGVQ